MFIYTNTRASTHSCKNCTQMLTLAFAPHAHTYSLSSVSYITAVFTMMEDRGACLERTYRQRVVSPLRIDTTLNIICYPLKEVCLCEFVFTLSGLNAAECAECLVFHHCVVIVDAFTLVNPWLPAHIWRETATRENYFPLLYYPGSLFQCHYTEVCPCTHTYTTFQQK